MTTFVVPSLDEEPWPTLGSQVCDWIEAFLIHGPGDIRGEPAKLDAETRGLIYRAYEVYPRGHDQAGRRRFKRVGWSLRKGTAKTEKAAWLAAAELHPDAPVRADGWKKAGGVWQPVGVGVSDPYIPLVAYTEEQSDELAYAALYVIVSEGPLADDFDIGLERIMRIRGDGKAVSLASAPDARDGARTTFQVFDETHRMTLPRLKEAHRTMLANIPKRRMADAWSLETTTAYTPGEGSVAEGTMEYARAVAAGDVADPRLFLFHRQAGDDVDLEDEASVRAGIVEASGPASEWSDIDGIISLWADPTTDRRYFERVWLNRPTQASAQAFDVARWRELAVGGGAPAPGTLVTLGFDGARFRDATACVGTEVESGRQWVVGIWERPEGPSGDGWEVPEAEVEAAIAHVFDTLNVWRLYADPPYWEGPINRWAGRWPDRVAEWWTNRHKLMAYALRSYQTAMQTGDLTHDGNARMVAHIGHAQRRHLNIVDDSGERLWIIEKERPDSPHKIDAAMAGCLSWDARQDAIAAGALHRATAEPWAVWA